MFHRKRDLLYALVQQRKPSCDILLLKLHHTLRNTEILNKLSREVIIKLISQGSEVVIAFLETRVKLTAQKEYSSRLEAVFCNINENVEIAAGPQVRIYTHSILLSRCS